MFPTGAFLQPPCFGILATPDPCIFGGQTVVSVGQGTRNCWFNSFCSLWLRGNSGQWLDSSPVLRRIWHSGTGKGYNQPMSQNCFLDFVNAQKSWSKEPGQQSNLHVRNVSVNMSRWRFTGCISGLVFFSTVFWIMKSELIRAMDSSKWNENRSFCLEERGIWQLKKKLKNIILLAEAGVLKVWSLQVAAAWRGVRMQRNAGDFPSQSYTCATWEPLS